MTRIFYATPALLSSVIDKSDFDDFHGVIINVENNPPNLIANCFKSNISLIFE